jgi:hypothetical protein
MAETFLILFAGGVMLAAAVSDPHAVTLHWLRLAGIIALALGGVAMVFHLGMREGAQVPAFYMRIQWGLLTGFFVAVLGQLAFVQVAWRQTQRLLGGGAFVLAVLAGANLLHEMMIPRGTAEHLEPKGLALAAQALACAGVAAMSGLALMDMLLGHAYLTASRMPMSPFRRLNFVLAGAVVVRVLLAVGLVLVLQSRQPVEMLWGLHGLLIGTRWAVGLVVSAVFVWMADDCIRRRATQSATGILYVAGVLIVIGEIVALHLVRETGLPFGRKRPA